jgi:hypothetical protein
MALTRGIARLALAGASVAGCAPSAATLVARRDYDEALCAVAVAEPGERARVLRAIRRDAAPRVHVHAVTEDELAASIGARAERVHALAVILNTTYDTNEVTLDRVRVDVRLASDRGMAREIDTGRESLAALTGEPIPGYVTTSEWRVGQNDLLGAALAAIGTGVLFGTINFLDVFGYHRVSTRPPTEVEYAAAAPAADALYRSAYRPWAPSGAPAYRLFARPSGGGAHLEIRVEYEATSERFGNCDDADEIEVALPAGAPIDSGVNVLFGDRMRGVYELGEMLRATSAGASPAQRAR